MKTITAIFLLFTLLFSVACTSETKYGACIGAFDDGEPELVYRASGLNIVVGVIFVETIIVPAIVLLSETKCPVATRKLKESPDGDRR